MLRDELSNAYAEFYNKLDNRTAQDINRVQCDLNWGLSGTGILTTQQLNDVLSKSTRFLDNLMSTR